MPRLGRIATAAGISAASIGLVAGSLAVAGTAGEPPDDPSTWSPPRQAGVPATTSPPVLPARAAPPGSRPLGLRWSRVQPGTFGFVARTGGGWTFAEVEWCDVEPRPGAFRWDELDRVVREARELGYRTMLKLRTGQCWATEGPSATAGRDLTENVGKDPSTPATDLAAHLAFVRAVVRRYAARGVDDFAVENEPDTVNHWAAPIADYRVTARRVAAAIHHAHPGAHVLDGGVSSTAYGVALAAARLDRDPRGALRLYRSYYARRLAGDASRFPAVSSVRQLRTVLRSAPARRAVRAVDVAVGLANAGVVDAYQLHYYEPADRLLPVLRFLEHRLRDRVPVESWEVGVAWPGAGYDERRHATEVYRVVARLLAAQARPVVYLPAAYSVAPGKQQVFRGLTEPEGTVLPAGAGWAALSEALSGLRDRRLRPATGRLVGVAWRVGGRQAALVWAARGRVRLDRDDVRSVRDATGARVPGPPVVGRAPVLVLGSADGRLVRAVSRGRR